MSSKNFEKGRNIKDADFTKKFVLRGIETGLERRRGGVDKEGWGVFATQDFRSGDYICLYKGEYMLPEAALYLSREDYRRSEYQMWVHQRLGSHLREFIYDASDPVYETSMGRNINHARGDKANIVPRLFELRLPGWKDPRFVCVYFKAIRDIKAGEEILYDYADTRAGTTLGHWNDNKSTLYVDKFKSGSDSGFVRTVCEMDGKDGSKVYDVSMG